MKIISKQSKIRTKFYLSQTEDSPSQVTLVVNNPPVNAGVVGSIPGSGRSPGGGHGNPLQDSCLENPMDKEPGGPQSMGSQESDTSEAT